MSNSDTPSNSPINGGGSNRPEPPITEGGSRYKQNRVAGDRIRGYPFLKENILSLRKKQTVTEAWLWQNLRGKQLNGLKFRRQHGIGPFIVDFYCDEHKLIIEIDGSIHDLLDVAAHDAVREQSLLERGYRMLRFTNDRVKSDMPGVLQCISEHCTGVSPSRQ